MGRDGDDVDRLVAALSGDPAAASTTLQSLLDRWNDRLTDALLNTLQHDLNPTVRQRAVIMFAYQRSAETDDHIVDGLLRALDDPEPGVRSAAMAVLYQIAYRKRSARRRIVEAFRGLAANDPWDMDARFPLRQQADHFVHELAPFLEGIEEMQESPFPPEAEIAGLQTRLDVWTSTIYPSLDERRQALADALAPYEGRPMVRSVALSRLLDRLSQLVGIVGPIEGEAREKANIYDCIQAGMADTREGRPSEEDDKSDAEHPSAYASKELIGEREFEYAHGYYPRWLKRDLIDGAFPWEAAQTATLARFLEEYTLHDSLVIGLWLAPETGATLIVRWDPAWVNYETQRIDFWPEGRTADVLAELRHGDDVAFWPLLLIRIERVYHLRQRGDPGAEAPWHFSDVYAASSGPMAEERRLAIEAMGAADAYEDGEDAESEGGLVPPDAHETLITGREGYELRLVHDPSVSLLCLSRQGTVLHVPGLEVPLADTPS